MKRTSTMRVAITRLQPLDPRQPWTNLHQDMVLHADDDRHYVLMARTRGPQSSWITEMSLREADDQGHVIRNHRFIYAKKANSLKSFLRICRLDPKPVPAAGKARHVLDPSRTDGGYLENVYRLEGGPHDGITIKAGTRKAPATEEYPGDGSYVTYLYIIRDRQGRIVKSRELLEGSGIGIVGVHEALGMIGYRIARGAGGTDDEGAVQTARIHADAFQPRTQAIAGTAAVQSPSMPCDGNAASASGAIDDGPSPVAGDGGSDRDPDEGSDGMPDDGPGGEPGEALDEMPDEWSGAAPDGASAADDGPMATVLDLLVDALHDHHETLADIERTTAHDNLLISMVRLDGGRPLPDIQAWTHRHIYVTGYDGDKPVFLAFLRDPPEG